MAERTTECYLGTWDELCGGMFMIQMREGLRQHASLLTNDMLTALAWHWTGSTSMSDNWLHLVNFLVMNWHSIFNGMKSPRRYSGYHPSSRGGSGCTCKDGGLLEEIWTAADIHLPPQPTLRAAAMPMHCSSLMEQLGITSAKSSSTDRRSLLTAALGCWDGCWRSTWWTCCSWL